MERDARDNNMPIARMSKATKAFADRWRSEVTVPVSSMSADMERAEIGC
jgi:hypothetical protein